jgi:asparagine synthase (glutamine-hydrolysing)
MLDSSMVPTFLVSQLVRQHCTVALGGDGGDELFGGYSGYDHMLRMRNRFGKVPAPLRQLVSTAAERLLPVGLKGRNWLHGLGADLERSLPLIGSVFTPTPRKRLMSRYGNWQLAAEAIFARQVPVQTDLLQRATRMDFANYLAEDILVKVDRTSMLNSLEVRAPFLDYPLVEFAFGKVSSNLKATVHDRKILLKRLAARVLPAAFDRQRKQGFSMPLASWLRAGAFRGLFHDVLSAPDIVFDRRIVRALLRGQDRGRGNGERLFALVLFELWRREYRASLA